MKADPKERWGRFGCGTIFGIAAGFSTFMLHLGFRPVAHALVSVGFGVVCGLLAVRMGDRFWRSVADLISRL